MHGKLPSTAREGENSQWLFEGAMLGRSGSALARERSKSYCTRQLHRENEKPSIGFYFIYDRSENARIWPADEKENNHLRVVVVFKWSFLQFCLFWAPV